PKERQIEGRFPMEVIPLDRARQQIDAVPHGSILMVVREARPLLPTRITHLGIVVRRKGRTCLRHASRSGRGTGAAGGLATSLTGDAGYRRWPVVGVSVVQPQEREGRSSPPVACQLSTAEVEGETASEGKRPTPPVVSSDGVN